MTVTRRTALAATNPHTDPHAEWWTTLRRLEEECKREENEPTYDRKTEEAGKYMDLICETPANTLDGLLVQARFQVFYEEPGDNGPFSKIIQTMHVSLERMAGAS